MHLGTFGTLNSTETSNWTLLRQKFKQFDGRHEERLLQHENVEAIQLLENTELLRRLKRTKPLKLVS
jgi:hypothetical protein